ncbi:MAG: type II toxin-antitoxin system VapB family antitoxin [Acidobacteria bacterium]|nr:type II toxin-antitoxin system VapB family antitoxin [Acidobacteriota bacterium]
MRTTVDINDALLQAAKSRAARDRRSLKAVVDQALREFLSRRQRTDADGPPIPVFRGRGVQPGVDLTDNAALEDLMNAEP